ncbi:hypothetical protein EDC01DRAFT_651372 [Geopyxis carbonaria]|nr:hypothetical protein EDC01DRAFT_651372 [Geopyxis carbonaria]
MKLSPAYIIAAFSVASAASDADCTSPPANSCAFYTSCLEPAHPCGSAGYAVAYGSKYCNAFVSRLESFSPEGQAWISDTMLCLQRALVPEATGGSTGLDCEGLRKFAFSTHPDCYVDNGLCSLPPTDWVQIVKTVDLKTLFGSKEALEASILSADGCVDFYQMLLDEAIVEAKGWWDKKKDGAWWWPGNWKE